MYLFVQESTNMLYGPSFNIHNLSYYKELYLRILRTVRGQLIPERVYKLCN